MAENPLYGDELLELGKALTSEIHAIVENGRAYYLGLSPHEPPSLLSKVFNPETGPIIPYLVKVIRMLTQPQRAESHPTPRQSAALREFERESAATSDALRRLAIDLAPLLDADGGQKAIGRSLKLSLYFFRVASERFFRYLTWRRSIFRLLLKNHNNEGFGLYIADRLLNDHAKGFDPEKNGVRIRMRLLDEIDVDITDWEFRDVTPGRNKSAILMAGPCEARTGWARREHHRRTASASLLTRADLRHHLFYK